MPTTNTCLLEDDVNTDLGDSSFVKAIKVAEGRVVSVIDSGGVTYSRIWCCLEIYLGLSGTYEMYTAREGCAAYNGNLNEDHIRSVIKAGEVLNMTQMVNHLVVEDRDAVGITEGLVAADSIPVWGPKPGLKAKREEAFPLDLVRRAFTISVQDGKATRPVDRRRILNYIAGRRGRELELDALETCRHYDKTNACLHGRFTMAVWRRLLETGEPLYDHGQRILASEARKLSLSLAGCAACTDEGLLMLAESLPSTLEELTVTLGSNGACGVTMPGGRPLLDHTLRRMDLTSLRILDLNGCRFGGTIPEALGKCIALEQLHLAQNGLVGPIPDSIGRCTHLQGLALDQNALTGVIPDSLRACTQLKKLYLYSNCLSGRVPATALAKLVVVEQLALNDNLDLVVTDDDKETVLAGILGEASVWWP